MDANKKDILEKGYNEIHNEMEKLNKQIQVQKEKDEVKVEKLKEAIFPQDYIEMNHAGFTNKIKNFFKEKKFKKKVKNIKALENEYKKEYDKLKQLNINWVYDKNKLEDKYVNKVRKLGFNLNKIEHKWKEISDMKNSFKEELVEIEKNSLLLLRDNNQWYSFDGVTDGIWFDPIYNNVHYIDPKRFRDFKFGNRNIKLATGNVRSVFLDQTDVAYDAETMTGLTMSLLAQVEKMKNINKKEDTGMIIRYIIIAVIAIVGLLILWNVILPIIFPSMKSTGAQVATEGAKSAGSVIDANVISNF